MKCALEGIGGVLVGTSRPVTQRSRPNSLSAGSFTRITVAFRSSITAGVPLALNASIAPSARAKLSILANAAAEPNCLEKSARLCISDGEKGPYWIDL
jgi:hypothetical protein